MDVTGDAAKDAVYDLTDGKGADIVIEAVGSTPTLSNAFHLVADEGLCVLFGLPDSNDPQPFDYTEMFKKRANAYSILGAQEEPGLKTFRRALSWIVEGEIRHGTNCYAPHANRASRRSVRTIGVAPRWGC